MKAILIATGDEITQGDILNTTGPAIARRLAERNIEIIKHVMIPDGEAVIQTAIEEAMTQADYVFTTGGLGPTSDDLTRFALAKAMKREVQFDQDSWQAIIDRLSKYKLHIHEDNKRQAYFPEGAVIFDNPNGTARGCSVTDGNHTIFMLPGPPSECIPMFEDYVLNQLPKAQQHKMHWLLLGASEGETAADIDQALTNIDCQTGYRADYPYLEIKAWAKNNDDLQQIETIVEPLVSEKLVSKHNKIASTELVEILTHQKINYKIFDAVTGGVLQSALLTPATRTYIQFINNPDDADISITGLEEFWQNQPAPGHSKITLKIQQHEIQHTLFYRGASVRTFVTEWCCWQLIKTLCL